MEIIGRDKKGWYKMDNLKYTLLTEVIGRWKADVIENYLKADGIDVVLVEATVSDLFTPTYGNVKIFVLKEDLQRATVLLKTFNESEDHAKEK